MDERERIRRAFFDEHRSRKWIERELHHDRLTINRALRDAIPPKYQRTVPRTSPMLGTWRERIDVLWAENETLPRKQRLTAKRIFDVIEPEGYCGSARSVRSYIQFKHKADKPPPIFLKLDYDPGVDIQVDWGEAVTVIAGEDEHTQFLLMRACYSRKIFVRAYPTQKQESFLDGLASGFEYFGGVFKTLWFDNLKTAVQDVLKGKTRRENRHFTAFRSHYLFDAVFCTPGEGHEKGGVENGIGYTQRNLFSPLLVARNYQDLNEQLLKACQADDQRTVTGQSGLIAQAWEAEHGLLKPLPSHRFPCCSTVELTLDGYGLITFETNRYSVPVEKARKLLTVKAYPYSVNIINTQSNEVIASHPRNYGKGQEVIDPVHFLPLLEQRTGAFDHSRAMRLLRADLPPIFEKLLTQLQRDDGRGVREFVRILRLLEKHSMNALTVVVKEALDLGAISRDAIELILHTHNQPASLAAPLDPAKLPVQALLAASDAALTPNIHLYDTLLVAS